MSTLLNIESQSGGINVIKPNIKNQETNDFNKIDNKSHQKTKKEDEFVFPNFKDIKVSTRTFIAHTNITIDINSLFQSLPITPYEHVPKKRGRKKKNEAETQNKSTDVITLDEGSIISLKFENNHRGFITKKKKSNSKGNWFRNSVSIVMVIDNKMINYKVSKNGVLQITGCKTKNQAYKCVKYLWEFINKNQNIYKFKNNDISFNSIFIPAMRNIDFYLGFNIDREKLSQYMSTTDDFRSLLETSFGYTGVNVKIPIHMPITKIIVKKLSYNDNNDWDTSEITYQDYLDTLEEKERIKKIKKERYTSFLIFHSGKVIQSSTCSVLGEHAYNIFIEEMKKCSHIIKERLDV